MNDRSVVSVMSDSEGNRAIHYRAGKLRDLGTLAGADTYPIAINNCGEVVGQGVAGSGLHAFSLQRRIPRPELRPSSVARARRSARERKRDQ